MSNGTPESSNPTLREMVEVKRRQYSQRVASAALRASIPNQESDDIGARIRAGKSRIASALRLVAREAALVFVESSIAPTFTIPISMERRWFAKDKMHGIPVWQLTFNRPEHTSRNIWVTGYQNDFVSQEKDTEHNLGVDERGQIYYYQRVIRDDAGKTGIGMYHIASDRQIVDMSGLRGHLGRIYDVSEAQVERAAAIWRERIAESIASQS